MPDPTTLTLDEAIAILEGNEVLETPEAMEQRKKEKEKAKVKDLLKEGAKQGRGGLGLGSRRQLEQLEEDELRDVGAPRVREGGATR